MGVKIVIKGGFKSEDTGEFLLLQNKYSKSMGVFRTLELRVLTVIDCPNIAGAKGL